MRKLLLYALLLLMIVAAVMAYNIANHAPAPDAAVTPTPAPWMPGRVRIPALNVDAPVINVGASDRGVMDAPTSKALHSPYWTSVFWYAPGAVPGQAGNAVIAGHVDRVGGDPAVFAQRGLYFYLHQQSVWRHAELSSPARAGNTLGDRTRASL